MSAVDQTLTLAPITPALPLVLCDAPFLHTLAVIEREVAGMVLADAQDNQNAANYLQRLTTAGTKLEAARTQVKKPFLDKCNEIDAAAKAPAKRIEAAKNAVKAKVTAFNDEQARIALKLEEDRQKELRRLEALRREEERVANEKAAALAAQIAAAQASSKMVLELPEFEEALPGAEYGPAKTATEKAIEAVRFAPVVAPVKPAGVAYKTFLVVASVDAAKLPDAFVTREPKMQAIRATFCTGWRENDPLPECPGCTFKIERTISSTGGRRNSEPCS